MLYNVPGPDRVNILPETIVRLAQVPGIVAVKEASGSLDASSEIVASAPDGFAVLSGDDSLTLPIIAVGGQGVISVASNIVPEAMSALTDGGACRRVRSGRGSCTGGSCRSAGRCSWTTTRSPSRPPPGCLVSVPARFACR